VKHIAEFHYPHRLDETGIQTDLYPGSGGYSSSKAYYIVA